MKPVIVAIIFTIGIAFVGYRCYPKRSKETVTNGYTIPVMTAEQREELISIADRTDLSLQDQKQWKDFWNKMIVPINKKDRYGSGENRG